MLLLLQPSVSGRRLRKTVRQMVLRVVGRKEEPGVAVLPGSGGRCIFLRRDLKSDGHDADASVGCRPPHWPHEIDWSLARSPPDRAREGAPGVCSGVRASPRTSGVTRGASVGPGTSEGIVTAQVSGMTATPGRRPVSRHRVKVSARPHPASPTPAPERPLQVQGAVVALKSQGLCLRPCGFKRRVQ